MSDTPQSDRLEAVLTLPSHTVVYMIGAIEKRRCKLVEELECNTNVLSRQKLLAAAHYEAGEMMQDLLWHRAQKRPYRYVVPLTPEEGRALNEELNGGPGSTHP